jgi:hypothetical protein
MSLISLRAGGIDETDPFLGRRLSALLQSSCGSDRATLRGTLSEHRSVGSSTSACDSLSRLIGAGLVNQDVEAPTQVSCHAEFVAAEQSS